MPISAPRTLACALTLLLGCAGKDGDDASTTAASGTSAASSTASAGTGSLSDTSTSNGSDTTGAMTNATNVTGMTGTTATTATTDTTDTATSTTSTTTSDDSTGTTTGGVCEIELPDPGACNGGATPHPTPTLRAGTPGAPRALTQSLAGPGPGEDELAPATDTEGCAFLCDFDLGDPMECDLFAQDCPPGEKCNAWANDGGSSWNATRCVPVQADPDKIGEPCTVEGSGVSGLDSCEAASMCWAVDSETNMGTCVALCTCSYEQPICTVPNTTCTISNGGSLVLCLPVCDPLDPASCGAGEVCVSGGNEYFQCVVDASGSGGATGDPCEYVNACDPGHSCVESGLVPGCQGGIGCCAAFCDISSPSCTGGTECVAWFEQGQAPKCFEDVGVCISG
ncbi:MAG: hypothetical protein R3B09_02885 [Nannocystaceae bacterium]